jgi:predicted acylesterase/phospholipase RssA
MSSAYQVGVFSGLVSQLSAEEVAYQSISGVAGGAVNAAILSSFPVGQEVQAAAEMQTFWREAATTPLYKDWVGGLAQGLLIEGGLYNSAPLKSFLKS